MPAAPKKLSDLYLKHLLDLQAFLRATSKDSLPPLASMARLLHTSSTAAVSRMQDLPRQKLTRAPKKRTLSLLRSVAKLLPWAAKGAKDGSYQELFNKAGSQVPATARRSRQRKIHLPVVRIYLWNGAELKIWLSSCLQVHCTF